MKWSVEKLSAHYGSLQALDQVSLGVGPGESLAVIGGDGAGKSTLLKALVGLDVGQTGTVDVPAGDQIAFVPGGGGVFDDLTVGENIEFVARTYRLAQRADSWRARADALLDGAGLDRFRDRLAKSLSGGQRRKLAGALALLPQPRLLVLDEVTTGVDPTSRLELWRLVSGAMAHGTAVVSATTYLDEAERADRVVLLHQGRMLGTGTPDEVIDSAPGAVVDLDAPTDPFRAWRVGRRWRQWAPRPVDRTGGKPIARLSDAAVVLELAAQPPDRGDEEPGSGDGVHEYEPGSADRSPNEVLRPADTGALLDVRAVTKRFGAFTAVDEVDLTVGRGEIVGLLGANGAGKTTVIKMALGLLEPSAGSISLFGGSVGRAQRQRLGYVPQNLGLYRDLTADENLEFRAEVYGTRGSAATRSGPVTTAAGSTLVADLALGAQRRLAFAAARLHGPEMLILDEPTSGVSPLARSRLWDVIHQQADRGVGVLVSTHYMDEAEQADRVVIMSHGRVVAAGRVADIVAGRSTVAVDAEQWGKAFDALDRPGRRLRLSGRTIRILGEQPADIHAELAGIGLTARVSSTPASLEEVLIELDDRTEFGVGAPS